VAAISGASSDVAVVLVVGKVDRTEEMVSHTDKTGPTEEEIEMATAGLVVTGTQTTTTGEMPGPMTRADSPSVLVVGTAEAPGALSVPTLVEVLAVARAEAPGALSVPTLVEVLAVARAEAPGALSVPTLVEVDTNDATTVLVRVVMAAGDEKRFGNG
jgi:hypothetical protein